MSSNTTSTSKEQRQDQVDVSTQTEQQQQQSIQNIPNRRPMKTSSTKKKASKKSAGAFRTISEVANELGVQQHVLRFWESKFSYVQPLKRGGGRRYYNPKDIALLKDIQHLLYSEGYTIKGVQKLLQKTRGNLASVVADKKQTPIVSEEPKKPETIEEAVDNNRDELKSMLAELKSMRDLIE